MQREGWEPGLSCSTLSERFYLVGENDGQRLLAGLTLPGASRHLLGRSCSALQEWHCGSLLGRGMFKSLGEQAPLP